MINNHQRPIPDTTYHHVQRSGQADLSRPKVGPWPDLAHWTRRHCKQLINAYNKFDEISKTMHRKTCLSIIVTVLSYISCPSRCLIKCQITQDCSCGWTAAVQ